MRSQNFRGTAWFFIVWALTVLVGVKAHAQEADGFSASFGDGVAAVKEAPCTLVLTALDAKGNALSSFDWTDPRIGLSGLSTPHGAALGEIPSRVEASGAERYVLKNGELAGSFDPVHRGTVGRTGFEIKDGILTLTNVVLTGDVVVSQGDARYEVVDRSITPWAAIIPPLVAILLAIITRQVLIALFVGIWVGMWAIVGGPFDGFMASITEALPQALTESRVKILIFSCLLGSVVAMVARMGGSQALVELMTRFGKTPRGAQLTTWFAGIFVFFDDYANALLVGNTMRPVTDRYRVSREKLSFLVDATSAPVACIFVISTWIAAEIGYIEGKLGTEAVQAASGLNQSGAYQVFLSTIPYNFYPILCLFFGFMVCLTGRDFGPMLRAERRARKEGKVLRDGAQPLSSKEMDDLVPADPTRLKWYNAVVPIGSVVLCVILFLYASGADSVQSNATDLANEIKFMVADGAAQDVIDEARQRLIPLENPPMRAIFGAADSYNALLLASAIGVIICGLMALVQKLMPLKEVVEVSTSGIKAMIPAALVLIMAWGLQGVCEKLNTSQFLIYHVSFTLNYLPAVVFALAAVVGFSTGSSWGTMGILIPLTIDYACGMSMEDGLSQPEVQQVLAASVGAVLAGAVFGDHCSPISDTTIMSSMASGADHVDHVRTQMPYALAVAAIALVFGYLPAGFGVSPFILLPLGLAAVVAVMFIFGRKVDQPAD